MFTFANEIKIEKYKKESNVYSILPVKVSSARTSGPPSECVCVSSKDYKCQIISRMNNSFNWKKNDDDNDSSNDSNSSSYSDMELLQKETLSKILLSTRSTCEICAEL